MAKRIYTLDGHKPHPAYRGWANFLKTCDKRDEYEGAIFYGVVNCNYILLPSGLLIHNFGFHGKVVMNTIRAIGIEAFEKHVRENYNNLLKDLEFLRLKSEKLYVDAQRGDTSDQCS